MNTDQTGRTTPENQTPDVGGAARQVSSTGQDAARMTMDTAKQQGQRVADTVRDQASQVSAQAKDALRGRTEGLKNGVAHGLDQAAVAVRSRATEMNRGDLGMRLAQPLETSADYLRQTPVENMPQDLARTVSANPLRSVAIAFVAGYFVGQLFKRR